MLVSFGALTDNLTLFYPQNSDGLFPVIVLKTDDSLPPSSAFQVIVCPMFLVNSAAKIFQLSLGCHPLDGVTRGGQPPSPSLSTVTPLGKILTTIWCPPHSTGLDCDCCRIWWSDVTIIRRDTIVYIKYLRASYTVRSIVQLCFPFVCLSFRLSVCLSVRAKIEKLWRKSGVTWQEDVSHSETWRWLNFGKFELDLSPWELFQYFTRRYLDPNAYVRAVDSPRSKLWGRVHVSQTGVSARWTHAVNALTTGNIWQLADLWALSPG